MRKTVPGVLYLRYSSQKSNLVRTHGTLLAFKRLQIFLGALKIIFIFPRIVRFLARLRIGDKLVLSLPNLMPKPAVEGEGPKANLITSSPGDGCLLGLRTLLALGYALDNYDFDYIFKINSSAYVDGELLLRELDNFAIDNVYAGVVGEAFRFDKFASGAGTLISRDVAEKIVSAKSRWRFGLIEDVAMADVVSGFQKTTEGPIPLRRITVSRLSDAKALSKTDIRANFHFRCKSNSPRETVEIMKHISLVKSQE